ncbi:MAG: hypothetical protein GF317_07620 [Candidatus Lokiarchaeota archaeon]|nr:hypothetical protein [Candidatus Lokiarchaeota archaeon]MBD3199580.1 hypothetical protein [Candidatus Lokiarchaeota archaeon]
MKYNKIVLLSPVWRCGSTWIQRCLNSSDDLIVWGENHDLIKSLREKYDIYNSIENRKEGEYAKKIYDTDGKEFNNWIANSNPPKELFIDSVRKLLDNFYYKDNKRWGFKEVRYGIEEIKFLNMIYDDIGYIFLVRDIIDSYHSYRYFIRKNRQISLDKYIKIYTKRVKDFINYNRDNNNAILVRYEDLDYKKMCEIVKFAGIEPNKMTEEAYHKKIGGSKKKELLNDHQLNKLKSAPIRGMMNYG